MPTDFVGLSLYLYLLPGIAGYFVYESLAETKSRDTVDKIAMAITITLLSTLVSSYLFQVPLIPDFSRMEVLSNPAIISEYVRDNLWITAAIASFLGVLLAWIRNKGWAHWVFARIGVTKRTGLIDPWHQVFSKHQQRWIQVRFKDGKTLVGWPLYYSEDGTRRELFLSNAVWYLSTAEEVVRTVEVEDGVLLTAFDEVIGIDFFAKEDQDAETTGTTKTGAS